MEPNIAAWLGVIGTCITAICVLAYVIKGLADNKPKNGNGKGSTSIQAVDIQESLTAAVQWFRESHIENKMRQDDMAKTLIRIEGILSTCSDILKALPKRSTD